MRNSIVFGLACTVFGCGGQPFTEAQPTADPVAAVAQASRDAAEPPAVLLEGGPDVAPEASPDAVDPPPEASAPIEASTDPAPEAAAAPCGPTNCAGCCTDGVCFGGEDVTVCGLGGVACANCTTTGDECNSGACGFPLPEGGVECGGSACPACPAQYPGASCSESGPVACLCCGLTSQQRSLGVPCQSP